jgi:hypothetical protein
MAASLKLFFGTSLECRIRYDNERGKGDHRHCGANEEPMLFLELKSCWPTSSGM